MTTLEFVGACPAKTEVPCGSMFTTSKLKLELFCACGVAGRAGSPLGDNGIFAATVTIWFGARTRTKFATIWWTATVVARTKTVPVAIATRYMTAQFSLYTKRTHRQTR